MPTVAADAASLRDALRWVGQQPSPAGGFGRFALKANTNVSGTTVGLSNAHLELVARVGGGHEGCAEESSYEGSPA